MRDTALPHLPPHLGTSPCKPVAMWVPPSCNTHCWKSLRCGLIRRSLNSRSLFSFYRVPKPSFLLASNLPNIPTLFVYILLPRLHLVSQNGPAVRAIASSAHISYCSGTKVCPFLSTETTPPVLLFQGRSSQEFPLIIAVSS